MVTNQNSQKAACKKAIYANLCVSPLDLFCVLLSSCSFHARTNKTLLQLQFNHLSCDIVRLYSRVSFAFVIVSILFHGVLKTSCLVRNINAAVKRSVCILTAKISVYGTVGAISASLLFCKTCDHLSLTLFKVSSAALFSISKCLNINFGCLLAKCSPGCFIFQTLAIQWSGSFLSVHGVAFENMASSYLAC